jgi:hypothetical protein
MASGGLRQEPTLIRPSVVRAWRRAAGASHPPALPPGSEHQQCPIRRWPRVYFSNQPRMVTVMNRKIAMLALLGGLAAGLGCNHIAGKSDCGYNPSDYPIGPPTPPYPSTPALPVPPSKDKAPDQIPRTTSGGSGISTPIYDSGY